MNQKIAKTLAQRKRNIRKRLDKRVLPETSGPILNPGNIHCEIANRVHGISCGGIGAVQKMLRQIGLNKAINRVK